MTDRVGFIGLGMMGAPMAERLLAAGVPLTVCDVNPSSVEPLTSRGAGAAATPREVADQAEIVFGCLPSLEVAREVALGADGIVHGSAVRVYVDTSTTTPEAASAIAQAFPAAVGYLDAPVSGGAPAARAGTMSVMVSGAKERFDRVFPALSAMAKHVFHVGHQPGMAQMAKLINNHLSIAGRLAAFEGLLVALKAGLDLPTLVDVFNVSSGQSYTTSEIIPAAILSGQFRYSAELTMGLKDETSFVAKAEALDVPLFVAPGVLDTLRSAAEHGYLHQDSMMILQYMGERAGMDVKSMIAAGR